MSFTLLDSGDLFLPKSIRRVLNIELAGSSKKTFYINLWSVLHGLSGVLVGMILLRYFNESKNFYLIGFVIHTLWEIWQVYIGMSQPYSLTGNSNALDIVIDTIMFMGGMYLYKIYYY